MNGKCNFIKLSLLGPRPQKPTKIQLPFVLGFLFLSHRVPRVKIPIIRQNTVAVGIFVSPDG